MRAGQRDTAKKAASIQVEALRRLPLGERAAITSAMSDSVRALTESGIRERHPEYSAAEVRTALVGAMVGKRLASRISGRG